MAQVLLIALLLVALFPAIRRRLGKLVWIGLVALLIFLLVVASAPH